jgi:hypothetical protein
MSLKPGGNTRKSCFSRLGNVAFGIIAPFGKPAPPVFRHPCPDRDFYKSAIAEIQRFRGRVYLEERAIPASALDEEERHFSEYDYRSWHLFILNQEIQVCGCLRATSLRAVDYSELKLHELIERMEPDKAVAYASAVQAVVDENKKRGVGTGEIGGWAIAKDLRFTSKAMLLASACWSLGRILNDHVGFAQATLRNNSALILRRLGGSPLSYQGAELPTFFDPHYGCDMEILTFDPSKAAFEHERTINDLKDFLVNALVISTTSSEPEPSPD